MLLFLLPTQLALHIWPSWSFVYGIRVDFLSVSIYLTDVLVCTLFIVDFLNRKIFLNFFKQNRIVLAFFIAIVILNSIFSVSPQLTLYRWFKVLEYIFLGTYFAKTQELNLGIITKTLFYSSGIFSLIGIIQFFKSSTIGGVFYLLGERTFGMGTPGIALVSLGGAEHLRAYSTFSHPNSLAGYLGAILVFAILSKKLKINTYNLISLFVILICLVLTFSVSAYIGIFFVFAFYLFSREWKISSRLVTPTFYLFVFGSLLLPIFSERIMGVFPYFGQNVEQRLDLAYMSGQIISSGFVLGKGLGTFIVNIPGLKGIYSYSWLLQPVHNIFLLVLSETGIGGLMIFLFLIHKSLLSVLTNKRLYLLLPILFILFTGLFDHYSLTLQQNVLLFSIFMGLAFNGKMA